jgi:hypothetical protein
LKIFRLLLNLLSAQIARPTLLASLAICASPIALAQDYRQFPGAPMDSRMLKIQERVEELFSSGEYDRALFIYERELAPQGDKYAQYMAGFMHLTGKGVKENPAVALAWYRLAAERGEHPFVKARDALQATLEPAQLEQSAILFAELWQRYGDRRLMLDLIKSDIEILRRDDGRRSIEPDSTFNIAVGYSGSKTSDGYYRRVRSRLLERLQYLGSTADADDAGIAADDSALRKLESEIRRELKSMNLR